MNNVGSVDKVVRLIAGVVLLSLIVVGPKTMWGLIGLVPLLTSLLGWCPAYNLIGMNTNKS